MTVLITLTTAGADSGPFDLYTNLDGYVSAFATGVSKSALLSGYSSSAVPDFATIIRVKSTGDCVNYIDITLVSPTTTTTSTSSTTTTTTTVAPALEAGGISSTSLTDPSTGCSLTIDSICYFDTAVEGIITSGDIVYNDIDGTSPINGGGLYYSVTINTISGFYQYVVLINSVGVMTVNSTCP
jgi:hypothetical protein